MRLAHNYNASTGVYTESTPACLDELETALGEGDVYLLPANATWTAPPPAPEGLVNVYEPALDEWVQLSVVATDVELGEPLPTLAEQRVAATRQVDADVDAVIYAVIGNRAAEYLQAEQEAREYLTALETGEDITPPPSVASDMAAFGHTSIDAANSILAQAAAWRGASNAMRAARLKAKQDILQAGDVETLAITVQNWVAFISGMRSALGV